MQDAWIILLSLLGGLILVLILLLIFVTMIRFVRRRRLEREMTRSRAPSRIQPKIANPIYAITANSIERDAGETMTTRKLSMMVESKKRLSSVFSQKSSNHNYFDFENSPPVKHKEYLDFNDINNILPKTFQTNTTAPSRNGEVKRQPLGARNSHDSYGSATNAGFEPVREIYSENHMSFRRDRPIDRRIA